MQNTIGKSMVCDAKIAGLYDLGETLGSGHFAIVKLARHVFTGETVAVKVVDKTKLDEVSRSHLFQEVRCMKLVQHPHVVRLYEVIDTQTKLYLVLELGDGGDLYDYIMKHEGGLSEDMARKYFGQIVRAISYCHQLHVVHRDLKPENVVFFEKLGIVKLTDFGFSNKFSPGQKLETSCGSLAYSAPEILLGDSYDAPAVDIWSLGVILYMLVCGNLPFEKANDSETLTMIMDCKYTMPTYISDDCRKLISSMLVREPEKRSTLEEISSNTWLTQNALYDVPDYQPLVSHQQVNEEDHKFIIQKMINGNVATKEDILQALDRDKYNHITATYFLLAERKLRQKRNEEKQSLQISSVEAHSITAKVLTSDSTCNSSKLTCKVTTKLGMSAIPDNRSTLAPVNETWAVKRTRKCSIVKEEEDEDEISDSASAYDSNSTLSRRGSRSEGRLNVAMQQVVSPIEVDNFKNVSKAENTRVLNNVSRDSTLDKLNETPTFKCSLEPINSLENLLDGIKISSEISHSLPDEKNLQKARMKNKNPMLTHRRTKIIQIRTPSCSSSEASDDESKSRKKKNSGVSDTPSRFRFYRRDSHDDSSDSQDQSNHTQSSRNTVSYVVCTSGSKDKGSNSSQDSCKENGKSRQTNSKQKRSQHSIMRTLRCMERKQAMELKSLENKYLDRICETHEYNSKEQTSNIYKKYNLGHPYDCSSMYSRGKESTKVSTSVLKNVVRIPNGNNIRNTVQADRHIYAKDNHDMFFVMDVKESFLTSDSRYSRAVKKISYLKRYFPLVNFS